MLPEQFNDHMRRLVAVFTPRGWDENTEKEYFRVFRFWGEEEWEKAVDRGVRELDRMPRPHQLFALRPKETSSIGTEMLVSCEHCIEGRIWYEMRRGQRQTTERDEHGRKRIVTIPCVYEVMGACDCKAGDVVARQIEMVGRAAKRFVSLQHTRYAFAARNVGGIITATGGLGVTMDGPELQVGDAGGSVEKNDAPVRAGDAMGAGSDDALPF